MNTNPSSPTHHGFRGSRLDKALGAILAMLLIAVPPFVYGHIGIAYALIVLNGLLIFDLRETMAVERARAKTKSGSIKEDKSRAGLVVFDGMGSLPADFRGLKDYVLIEPNCRLSVADLETQFHGVGMTGSGMTAAVLGPIAKAEPRFGGESWREKRRPQRTNRNKK